MSEHSNVAPQRRPIDMTMRSRRETAHFNHAFQIDAQRIDASAK
jgi:hypothetical protein